MDLHGRLGACGRAAISVRTHIGLVVLLSICYMLEFAANAVASEPDRLSDGCIRRAFPIDWMQEMPIAEPQRFENLGVVRHVKLVKQSAQSVQWSLCTTSTGFPRAPTSVRYAIRELSASLPIEYLDRLAAVRFRPEDFAKPLLGSADRFLSVDALAASIASHWQLSRVATDRLSIELVALELTPRDLVLAAGWLRAHPSDPRIGLQYEQTSNLLARLDMSEVPLAHSPCLMSRGSAPTHLRFGQTGIVRSLTIQMCDRPLGAFVYMPESGWIELSNAELCAVFDPTAFRRASPFSEFRSGLSCHPESVTRVPRFDQVFPTERVVKSPYFGPSALPDINTLADE